MKKRCVMIDLCFLIFDSVRKNEIKENYFWLTEKVWLIFKDCFPLIFFWKTTLSQSKLNKIS